MSARTAKRRRLEQARQNIECTDPFCCCHPRPEGQPRVCTCAVPSDHENGQRCYTTPVRHLTWAEHRLEMVSLYGPHWLHMGRARWLGPMHAAYRHKTRGRR